MGSAIYIVPETPVPGLDDFNNGTAVAKIDEVELDELCKRLKVTSIWAFVSQDPGQFADFFEDGAEAANDLPAEAWFDPSEGLRTVRALHGHLASHPQALQHAEELVEDLQDYEWVLSALEEQRVKWHFAVSA